MRAPYLRVMSDLSDLGSELFPGSPGPSTSVAAMLVEMVYVRYRFRYIIIN